MSDARSRNWVVEALGQLRHELVLYLKTVTGIGLRPRRFMLAWKAGQATAMNPLGFLAATLAAIGFENGLFEYIVPPQSDAGGSPHVFASIVVWAAPFAFYLALGIFAYLLLQLFRSAVRFLDAVAVALYAGGGPATVGGVIGKVGSLVYVAVTAKTVVNYQWHDPSAARSLITMAFVVIPFLWFCFALGAGLRGVASKVRRWQVTVAVILGVVTSGFMFGMLDPPGEYGFRPVFSFLPTEDGRHDLNIGFRF